MSIDQANQPLAVFGHQPAFAEKLHVGRPNIGDRDAFLRRVGDLLDRRWLSNDGPMVQEFERRLAQHVGVKHCLAVCNATVALEIAIRALGMQGEVILPSFTFIATAHALQWQQITPVFADIDPVTHTIDPGRIEALITPKTTGIIGVHLWGTGCDVQQLAWIARKHNLRLLYDAAHAFPSTVGGRMIGSFGDAEVFSFHATKFCNSLEGGAIATNDDALTERIKLMRNFGFSGYDRVVYVGTNGKMNEVAAAMGLTSLESLGDFCEANRMNYERYKATLVGIPGVKLHEHRTSERLNYQYVVVEIDEQVAGVSRDDLIDVLWAENVMARRYFYPGCHRMEPYRSLFPQAHLLLPETERVAQRVIVLPTGTTIHAAAIETIARIFRTAVRRAPDVTRALSAHRQSATPLKTSA